MIITYIGHSGFTIETDDGTTFIFDFFNDTKHIIESILNRSERVVVFVSHSHADHYNPQIFEWQKFNRNILYIISNEVRRKIKNTLCTNSRIDFIKVGESITNVNIPFTIQAYGSTDCGCSFMLRYDGKYIFHAGDLNNWHWKDESTPQEIKDAECRYLSILNTIKKNTMEPVFLAMFPVDSRIGTEYWLGASQFVHTLQVANFIPMHFWDNPYNACKFDLYKNNKFGKYYCLTTSGDSITI